MARGTSSAAEKIIRGRVTSADPHGGRVLDLLRELAPKTLRRLSELVLDENPSVAVRACREVLRLAAHPLLAPSLFGEELREQASTAVSSDEVEGRLEKLEAARARVEVAIAAERRALGVTARAERATSRHPLMRSLRLLPGGG